MLVALLGTVSRKAPAATPSVSATSGVGSVVGAGSVFGWT
jgi:hypothetical protein